MNNEQLFINTLSDLRERLKADTKYGYIRACGLLRHLLIDTPTLIDLANRKHRLQIFFKVRDKKEDPIRDVKIAEFLNTIVLRFNFQHGYSVKGIVNTVSHHLGGVHSSEPKDLQEIILKQLNNRETEFSLLPTGKPFKPPVIAAIKLIIGSTLEALEPLEKLLLEKS